MTVHRLAHIIRGSGASGDFGPEKARSRAEDRQTAKHICFNLSRFQSLTRPTREASAAHIRTVVRRCTRTDCLTDALCRHWYAPVTRATFWRWVAHPALRLASKHHLRPL